jgi:hypothetical protein
VAHAMRCVQTKPRVSGMPEHTASGGTANLLAVPEGQEQGLHSDCGGLKPPILPTRADRPKTPSPLGENNLAPPPGSQAHMHQTNANIRCSLLVELVEREAIFFCSKRTCWPRAIINAVDLRKFCHFDRREKSYNSAPHKDFSLRSK